MTDEIENTQDKAEDAEEVQNQTIDDLFEEKPADEKSDEADPQGDRGSEEEADAKAEAKTEEPAETPAAKEESVPLKALTEERRKRQEAENRAKELEAQLQKSDDKKVPDPVDDPEGYKQYMADEANLNALRTKVSLSRDIMLDAKPDYEEKEKVFIELAKTNPYLVQQMNASPNPAKFAYQTAVDHLEVQQYRDPKYREKLEAEIRAKVEKEYQEKQQSDKSGKKSALEVPDLTKATAAGKNSDKSEKEADLDDIVSDAPIDQR